MATINQKLNDPNLGTWGGESGALPPGEYTFQVTGATQELSQGKQTPQLVLDLEVVAPESLRTRTTKAWFMLQGQGETHRKRLKSLTEATQCPLAPDGSFDDQNLIGRQYSADVIVETYQKSDPTTGKVEMKERTKVVNERKAGTAGAATAGAPAAQPANGGQVPAYPRPQPSGMTPVG